MKTNFKYHTLYLSLFLSFSFLPNSFAVSSDPSDNLKATFGNKNNNANGVKVNPDGTIILGGKSESKKSEETIILSGGKSVPEIKSGDNSDKKTDKNTVAEDNNQAENTSEFQGGIGQPFYADTGVLIFNGSNAQEKEKKEKSSGGKNNSVPTDFYSSVPDIKLDKIPVSVNNMPIPTNLPPLPSENGNVMLPISLPTSAAVSLPPLPDFFVPNLGVSMGTTDQEGINNFGIPVNPDGKPINYQGKNSIFIQEKNLALSDQFVEHMRNAGNKFLSIGIPMKIVIVNTDDYEMRRFVANNILRSNKNNFESVDTGLTSILSLNTKSNNSEVPVCYIVLKNEQQKDLMSKYVQPLSKITDEKTVAAYLVAHQVSHCMDNLERFKQLPKAASWFPEDAKKIGLSSAAVRRLYPYGMTYNQYSRTTMHLYDDIGQRQYQERIGDIFGLYLTLFAGYDDKIIDGMIKLRTGIKNDSSHNTYEAIKNIKADFLSADKKNVKTLWHSARQVQNFKDIDPSLRYGAPESVYKASLNKNSDLSESSITEEFDPDKKPVNKEVKSDQPVNFNTVPHFGSSDNKKNYFGTSQNKTIIKE